MTSPLTAPSRWPGQRPAAAPVPGPRSASRAGRPRVDLDAAERAAADFLAALGIDADQDGLRETPGRMARAYAELFTAPPFELTTFPNDEGYDELVLARDIPFRTVCEHHLLPFAGVAHVGYLPATRSSGCPSWPAWSGISPPGRKRRNG